ncbi:MAG: hypothetical protein DLM52_01755 [Chthoniobacterales bacterium]|nr:MAG: hypothetical protein DLM52_01755 [Chthoniobacterales bacterium]
MGARAVVFACSTALIVGLARADLQLTPRKSEYELEGIKLDRLAFPGTSGKDPTYQQPPGWTYSGSASKLSLYPPGNSQAEARISLVALSERADFGEEGLKKLIAAAMACAPKDGTAVAVISTDRNPIKISGKETFRVLLRYNLFGQVFKRSVIFLNRERDQIRFEFAARDSDFDTLEQAFRSSLCTWRNL